MSPPILKLILVISTIVCQQQANIIFESDVWLEAGDACVVEQDHVKLDGLCMPIQNCSSILTNIIAQKSDYTVCGFDGVLQIVCCPRTEETKINLEQNMDCRVANSNETGVMKLRSDCSDANVNDSKSCTDDMCSRLVCCPVTSSKRLKNFCSGIRKRLILSAGGTIVNPGEYTHMAALGYKLNQEIEWKCGGSLISDRFVLTAAHCLTDRYFGSVQKVRLGALNLLTDDFTDDCPEDFDVARLIPHPDYDPKFVYNDIGLIKLGSHVAFHYHIQTICLPISADIPKTYKSMGWGATGTAEESSAKLLKVDQELFSYEECENQYNVGRRFPNGIMNDSHICAGSKDSIQSTCQGDSGGPLLSEQNFLNEKLLYVYGIVSFGSACGFANSPGVYTKVFPYVEWIEGAIYENMAEKTQNYNYCNASERWLPMLNTTSALFRR